MNKFSNLEALVTVVDAGSFSRAAERLGLAKSVISRRVRLLEEQLGAQLLQRTTRSLSLTGPGQQFYERAVRILAELKEAEQSITDASAVLGGNIRIAAPLSFGLHHLSKTLSAFLCEHPGIELDLDLNDREVNLVEEGFDMAVRIGTLHDSTLLARRVGTVRFATCASPDYLKHHGVPQHPAELEMLTGLHYANQPLKQAWQFSTATHETLTAIPAIRMRANNGDVLAAAAVAGLGVVTSPTFIVSDLIATGKLQTILDDFRRPAIGIYAVYPPGRLLPRRLRVFTDFLAESFGDLPYWDQALGVSGQPQVTG